MIVKSLSGENLTNFRGFLGLSQAAMGAVLGGLDQGTYKGWEKTYRIPLDIRGKLYEVGLNLNWLDTGEGEMLRPGVARIQIIRDESNGKPIKLVPVMENSEPLDKSGDTEPPTLRDLYLKGEAIVQEIEVEGKKPMNPDRRAQLVALAAEEVRDALQAGLPWTVARDKILRWWRATADIQPK